MRFFNLSSSTTTATATTTTATSATTMSTSVTSLLKQKAFVGSTFGICIAALGTANFFGYSGRALSQYISAFSLAALLGAQKLIANEKPFPTLLYQSSASHANTPLQHLRLLNNSPLTMSVQSNSPLFVHIHSNT